MGQMSLLDSQPPEPVDVVIVGAGLAGLACAQQIAAAGMSVRLLEAASAPGGRIRTDQVDGFLLDRGFQVLLTEYPEAQSILDYESLKLRQFLPGALVRQAGSFHRFADPFREPAKALGFLFDSIVPLRDKLLVARLRSECLHLTTERVFASEEESTREYLRRFGFSPFITERFFQPLFGGVFLERNLSTSARWFRWLFSIFARGHAAVPRLGMERLPQQLAARLPDQTLRLNSSVTQLEKSENGWFVGTESGAKYLAKRLVMATPEPQTRLLMASLRTPGVAPNRVWNRTTTIYYAASHAPVDEPVVVLNGDGPSAGPVNHLAVMSLVSADYAPPGAHLVCANIVGAAPESDEAMQKLESEVRAQMRRWFGDPVNRWNVLAGYPVAHALPMQTSLQPFHSAPVDSGVLICGDHVASSSIQGALVSGRMAAARILDTSAQSHF
uniref:Amine oxidase, flavin-containing n=1 Tax=mine drainage metagenome TaxID=410659 RepID=E6QJ23_9ZZZZ